MRHEHKVGMYVGRFQPIHNGHMSIIERGLEECDHLIIVIGSAQESGTKKNPFSFEFRKELIQRSLRGRGAKVTIIGVNDREEVKDDSAWGRYLLDEVEKQTGLRPTINFEGAEMVRSHWFDGIDIERKAFDRETIPISASLVRDLMMEDNFDFFNFLPTAIWRLGGKMQGEVWKANGKV